MHDIMSRFFIWPTFQGHRGQSSSGSASRAHFVTTRAIDLKLSGLRSFKAHSRTIHSVPKNPVEMCRYLRSWWPSQESDWTNIWSVSLCDLGLHTYMLIGPAVRKHANFVICIERFFLFFKIFYWGLGCRKQFCLLWLPRCFVYSL
jgi:hypothetical protein